MFVCVSIFSAVKLGNESVCVITVSQRKDLREAEHRNIDSKVQYTPCPLGISFTPQQPFMYSNTHTYTHTGTHAALHSHNSHTLAPIDSGEE